MGDFDIEFHAAFRNSLGHYAAIIERATGEAVAQATKEAEKFGKDIVPHGTGKRDPRTVRLHEGIIGEQTSRTQGKISSTARHASVIEDGAVGHYLPAGPKTTFEWGGGQWVPAPKGSKQLIWRDEQRPRPYMDKIKEYMASRIIEIAKEKYPG